MTCFKYVCRFQLVGYGCMTCIGNSGPLSSELVEAIDEMDLIAVGILSGNRYCAILLNYTGTAKDGQCLARIS